MTGRVRFRCPIRAWLTSRKRRRWRQLKPPTCRRGMVTVPFNPELIKYRQQAVLVDCGNGVSALKPTKGEVGRTLENLAAAVVAPRASASCLCRICIRPHQRLSVPTMAPGVSERRDHGAGRRSLCLEHRCGRVIDAESAEMRLSMGSKAMRSMIVACPWPQRPSVWPKLPSHYRTACRNECTKPGTVAAPRLYRSISAKANATLNDKKMRETKERV